jgi:hypothetical protein
MDRREERQEAPSIVARQQNAARKVTLDARHADEEQEEGATQGVSKSAIKTPSHERLIYYYCVKFFVITTV